MWAVKRLSLADLTDKHLQWLQSVLVCAPDVELRTWLQDIADGKLKVYDVGEGIIGLYAFDGWVHVEFLAGKDMLKSRERIWEAVRDLAGGKPLSCVVVNSAVARFYKRLGFKPVGTLMRYENVGRSELSEAAHHNGAAESRPDADSASGGYAVLAQPLESGAHRTESHYQ